MKEKPRSASESARKLTDQTNPGNSQLKQKKKGKRIARSAMITSRMKKANRDRRRRRAREILGSRTLLALSGDGGDENGRTIIRRGRFVREWGIYIAGVLKCT